MTSIDMNVVDKLTDLASDHDNEFAQIVRGKDNFNRINEKLHSLVQWLSLFKKSYDQYNHVLLKREDIDNVTIELINFLSICNGILDVSDGLYHVAADYFTNVPKRPRKRDFTKSRRSNEEHDNYFKFNKNDKDYFKHIRAIFGQHPSNLKYSNDVKGFASWSFKDKHKMWGFDSDLYSKIYFDQDVKLHGINFHLYYDEIRSFTETQINYIETLIEFINEEIKAKLKRDCVEIDGWSKDLSLEEKLQILKQEINNRYVVKDPPCSFYAVEELEKMIKATRISNYEDKYKEYLSHISKSIEEIYENVSKCEQNELKYFNSFKEKMKDAIGNNYDKEKVSMYLRGYYRYHDILKIVMDKACEKLGISISHSSSDFYFIFYILGEIGEVAREQTQPYSPNKYTSNVILGIDAAWTNTKPSGVCLLKDDGYERIILKLSSSYEGFINNDYGIKSKPVGSKPVLSELLHACADEMVDCIAVDMPLSNHLIEGRRSSEKALSKFYGGKGAATHSPTKDRPGPIALDFVNELRKMGYRLSLKNDVVEEKVLIEVYPHASIIEYLDLDYRLPYKVDKKNSYKEWKALLPEERTKKVIGNLNMIINKLRESILNVEDFLPLLDEENEYRLWQLKAYEDMIDAIICALTGVNYITGNIKGYGENDGTIWVPYK